MRARIERSTALTLSTLLPGRVLAFLFVAREAVSRRALWLIAGLALAAAGCDGCDGGPPDLPASAAGDAGIFDLVPTPKKEETFELWKRAADGLTVSDGEAFPLAYTVPTCSTRYELRSQYLAEVAEGREPAGVEIVADLVANPDTDRLTWQMVSMRNFLVHDGERDERPHDITTWPPALVRTDGELWHEEKGPSTLWAAFSAIPPLVGLFPKLPKGAKLGDTFKWKVDSYSKRTTAKVEKRRQENPDQALPNFTPDSYEAEVTVAAWQRLGRGETTTDAAVLVASWSDEKKELDPTESERAERWLGRYVIAKNGRLIHAVAIAGRYQWWQVSSTERNSKIGSAEVELRLVEDCDTLTLPRFASRLR